MGDGAVPCDAVVVHESPTMEQGLPLPRIEYHKPLTKSLSMIDMRKSPVSTSKALSLSHSNLTQSISCVNDDVTE